MSIGSRLKEARIRCKMTQADLAKAVQVTTSAIGNYETGVSTPKEPVLIELMKALGVDANFLYQDYGIPMSEVISFSSDPAKDVTSDAEYEMLLVFRNADARAREDAIALLKSHQKK